MNEDDRQLAEMNQELELETIAALARCVTAGGNTDDLQFLAAQLGVGDSFKKQYGKDARR